MERDDRNPNVHYDEFHGQGGSYIVGPDGKRVRNGEPTRDHPEGNKARDKDGKPIVDTAADASATPTKPTAK